jgi:hypothetical protein
VPTTGPWLLCAIACWALKIALGRRP